MDSDKGQTGAGDPPSPRWLVSLRQAAALCAFVFSALLVGSGIGLAMSYVPSQAEAFASVLYVRQQGGLGALLRAMHYHLSSAVVVATFVMVMASVLTDEHRERKWEYRLSVVSLLLMIGFCFTGYVLPMDQPAYWGTSVRLGIVETVPFVGGVQADMLRGGPTFGAATLPRFYALHTTALPLILVVLILVGFKDALDRAARSSGPRLIGACVAIAAAAWILAAVVPAPLEPRADAADTQYVPRPEWYFLWLFQFGKYVHGFQWVESAFLPAVGIGTLMLLPEFRVSARTRAIGVVALLAFMFGLGGLALYEDRDLPRKPQFEEGLTLKAAADFKAECASCHGVSGRGDGPDLAKLDAKPKDFTSPIFWDEDTMKDMVEIIRDGQLPDMPAFGGRLSEEQILAIAQHIKTNFRPAASGAR